jgi:ribosomal protection tetracycline resistance protein
VRTLDLGIPARVDAGETSPTEALRRAGSRVREPVHRFRPEAPAEAFAAVLPVLTRPGAVPRTTAPQGPSHLLEGDVPAARVHAPGQRLPTPTSGEGMLETAFDHYRPVTGPPPTRPRTDRDPLDREEYLPRVVRRVGGGGSG